MASSDKVTDRSDDGAKRAEAISAFSMSQKTVSMSWLTWKKPRAVSRYNRRLQFDYSVAASQ